MAAKIYSTEKRSLICKDNIIEYELIRKSVKNVNLRIDSAGNVKVSASRRVPITFIEEFIQEKQDFIRNSIEKINQRNLQKEKEREKTPMQFIEGETLRLLGKTLEIKLCKSVEVGIYFDEQYIYFQINDIENVHNKERLYENWIKNYQREVFEKICHQVHKRFVKFGVEYPEIRIRCMTSRWGSCQPYKGVITLNSRLIEMPLSCIEYVVMHEFSHFVHPNHSKEFHALMTDLMPDWKQRKLVLNGCTEGVV